MLAPANTQMEWDYASYQRKFLQTLAYTQVGEEPPSWRWIAAITDSLMVYEDARSKPIGQVATSYNGGEYVHDIGKYPLVQLHYRGFFTGAYRSKLLQSKAYLLFKRHNKSYKIGLSDETHMVYASGSVTTVRVSKDIDLSRPILSYYEYDNFEVFSPKLVRVGTTLYANGDNIAFMEKGLCVLRNDAFIPLLKPLLEGKWQIVSW